MNTIHIQTPDRGPLPVELYAGHAAIGGANPRILAYWDYRFELFQWACECYGVDYEQAALVLTTGKVLTYEQLELEMLDAIDGRV